MDDFQLLVDLHRSASRQGPGSDAATMKALNLAGLDRSRTLNIADIGCGTGASAFVLAKALDAEITAVDFLPEFLEELQFRAEDHDLAQRITPLQASMTALPFAEEEFDVIWSEGAIYNMGFEAGVSAWQRFLKPNGVLVVSEITWLSATRPSALQNYWQQEYPEIDMASAKLAVLERHGFSPHAYFVLPAACWLDHYYRPLESRFDAFLARHHGSPEAKAVIEAEQQEIALYEQFQGFYSYGVYVAKKSSD
jgi:SAM-dependent methyltransferase